MDTQFKIFKASITEDVDTIIQKQLTAWRAELVARGVEARDVTFDVSTNPHTYLLTLNYIECM